MENMFPVCQQGPLCSCQRRGRMSIQEGRRGGLATRQSSLGPWVICGDQSRSVGCPLFADTMILVLPMKEAQPQNQQNSSLPPSAGSSNLHPMPPPPSQKYRKRGQYRKLVKKPGMFSFPLLHLHTNKSEPHSIIIKKEEHCPSVFFINTQTSVQPPYPYFKRDH